MQPKWSGFYWHCLLTIVLSLHYAKTYSDLSRIFRIYNCIYQHISTLCRYLLWWLSKVLGVMDGTFINSNMRRAFLIVDPLNKMALDIRRSLSAIFVLATHGEECQVESLLQLLQLLWQVRTVPSRNRWTSQLPSQNWQTRSSIKSADKLTRW